MLNSKKIKYLTVIGTFSILSTAYFLHASSYYEKLHPLEAIQRTIPEIDKPLKVENKQVAIKKQTITPKVTKPLEKVAKIETKAKTSNLTNFLDKNRYLEIDSSGNLEPHAKAVLEKLIPMLIKLDKDSYIEIEGHSATKTYQYQTKRASQESAVLVENYLNTKLKHKKIVVTSYGDTYPIVDNKKDERNSRVELKIRRR